ncbi:MULTISPECIES: lysophospholipid acyltransferase family protein [unclassified Desulfovibrio]|uniref:lysophospholipid acyltransferase family protein n=1 Tax=unclassified Desulfovibrio TaxID=2593640 RepID=UPI000F5F3C81|nr:MULTISPECIES: lysophospholipid acyltransferase family protein [unclassified Desulfovibrio]RRD71200.1 1-acyl-sn-glycerol-3-phosphate acyltransferase [Desulfovibrio sp. OH1209_COT-279]RRD87488.1 1-acyl-sn-glycerol-3-phosphate acyltransferase [Desulfovibrio sp. OH1186_COT-070]
MVSGIAVRLVFLCWTLAVLPCMLCLAVLRPFCPRKLAPFSRRAIWFYGRGMLFWLRPWLPVHLRQGDLAVRFPASVMICNHQSFLDIYLLGAQAQANLCLVTKSWPFRRLFFFAPVMRCAGYIDVESLPVEQAEALCLQRLEEGATLVFFPEGRRTRTGALGKFRSGAFRVAVRAGCPVLPLLIRNSFQVAPPGGRGIFPAPVHMEFLSPVQPGDFSGENLPHRAMMRFARAQYARCLESLQESDT